MGAWVAGTKTLHRQHNSGSRNQTGSTQSSQTGPAQISSVQPSHARRSTNTAAAFHSAGLKPAIIKVTILCQLSMFPVLLVKKRKIILNVPLKMDFWS